MPTVWNKRQTGIPADAVYVGRPSKWGNPFRIGQHGHRIGVLAMYETWVMSDQQRLLREMAQRELRGKDLVCWCAPEACHADVLMRIANAAT